MQPSLHGAGQGSEGCECSPQDISITLLEQQLCLIATYRSFPETTPGCREVAVCVIICALYSPLCGQSVRFTPPSLQNKVALNLALSTVQLDHCFPFKTRAEIN